MSETPHIFCGHKELTPVDVHGYAICRDCGGAIIVTLTEYIFDKAVKDLKERQS